MDEVTDTTLAHPVEEFVPTLIVPDGESTIAVPLDADSNRMASRVVGAKLRQMAIAQIDTYTNKKGKVAQMNPTMLKDFVAAIAKIEDVNRFAFTPLDLDGSGKPGSDAADIMKSAMEGAMTGLVSATKGSDRAKKMMRLTKVGQTKEKEDEVIEIIE